MKMLLLCMIVGLIPVGVFVALRMTAEEPEPIPQKPLEQPVWKTKPAPPKPAPARPPVVDQTPGIKTYKAGEMVDLGSSKFGDKDESRGPILGNRRQYDMQYRFQRSSSSSEAPVQTQRGRNGQMKSYINR